ncbi:MAG TPA: FG-GAP-like repeat-containing protein [Patescibacteria group bacterium]|nr:FG-GAP-like repeat-containing protein [Patescibacteria group bacterium]
MSRNQEGCVTPDPLLVTEAEGSHFQTVVDACRRVGGRIALSLALVGGAGVAAGVGETMLDSHPAYATTFANDYPDGSMPCEHAPYNVTGACSNYDWGPTHTEVTNDPSELSSRGYGYRNCTDGVAYWVSKYDGTTVGGWGNATAWDTAAPPADVITGTTITNIEPGDIAQSDTGASGYGHVGFVTSVSKDANGNVTSFTTAEMNKGTVGEYSANTYNTRDSSGYFKRNTGTDVWDHFIDVNGPNKGLNGDVLNDPDTDGDGGTDSNDWCHITAGNPVNNGCPNDILQLAADVDGDGKKDVIAVSKSTADGSPAVSWFRSTSTVTPPLAGLADPAASGLNLPAPGWKFDNLKWVSGDFNGDSKDDLVAVSGSATDAPVVYEFLSNGSGFNAPTPVKSLNPTSWKWPLLEFFSGDFNGDGKSDLLYISTDINNNNPSIGWFQSTSTGMTPSMADPAGLETLPSPGWKVPNLKWAVGDFNGDHKADIAVLSGSQIDPPTFYEMTSSGSALSTPAVVKQPNPLYWKWPNLQIMAGDVDGDGKSDLVYVSRNPDATPVIGWMQSTSTLTTPSIADGVTLQSPGSGWLVDHLKWEIGNFSADTSGRIGLVAVSGSDVDGPVLYEFRNTGTSGLATPTMVKQPNPLYWKWPLLKF